MIKFERKFLYCFADIAAAKELIGKEGLFFDDFLSDKDLLTLEQKSLVDVLLPYDLEGRGFVFENNVDRYKFFYCDPNLECKRAFYLEGKEIQSRVKNSACKDWNNCPRPMWDDGIEYRIKPETYLTLRQVAEWLAKGNGQVNLDGVIDTRYSYYPDKGNDLINENFKIRKWNDTEWHEATKEYISEVEA